MSNALPENPLTDRESRIIEANADLPDACPNEECDCTPHVADLTADGTLYVSHEEDGAGRRSRSPRGETDGCRISPESDYTLGESA